PPGPEPPFALARPAPEGMLRHPDSREWGDAMDRFIAELFGTFVLVFVGVGAIVTGGFGGELPLGQVGIGLAFGLAVTAMAYTVGPISGAHLNPAVTVGVWLSGRMETDDVLPYIAAQVIGAIVGAAAIYGIATGQ